MLGAEKASGLVQSHPLVHWRLLLTTHWAELLVSPGMETPQPLGATSVSILPPSQHEGFLLCVKGISCVDAFQILSLKLITFKHQKSVRWKRTLTLKEHLWFTKWYWVIYKSSSTERFQKWGWYSHSTVLHVHGSSEGQFLYCIF